MSENTAKAFYTVTVLIALQQKWNDVLISTWFSRWFII